MSYRFDNRSEQEFIKDIEERTLREHELFLAWLRYIKYTTDHRPKYRNVGCGKKGEYIKNEKVSTAVDFLVEGYGLVEVKFATPMLMKYFHLKVRQLKSYQSQQATILMVNGAGTKNPTFTMISPLALAEIEKTCKKILWQGFGNRLAYRIPINKFVWKTLKR